MLQPRQKKGELGRVGSHAYVDYSLHDKGQSDYGVHWGGHLPFQMVTDGAGSRGSEKQPLLPEAASQLSSVTVFPRRVSAKSVRQGRMRKSTVER